MAGRIEIIGKCVHTLLLCEKRLKLLVLRRAHRQYGFSQLVLQRQQLNPHVPQGGVFLRLIAHVLHVRVVCARNREEGFQPVDVLRVLSGLSHHCGQLHQTGIHHSENIHTYQALNLPQPIGNAQMPTTRIVSGIFKHPLNRRVLCNRVGKEHSLRSSPALFRPTLYQQNAAAFCKQSPSILGSHPQFVELEVVRESVAAGSPSGEAQRARLTWPTHFSIWRLLDRSRASSSIGTRSSSRSNETSCSKVLANSRFRVLSFASSRFLSSLLRWLAAANRGRIFPGHLPPACEWIQD